MDCKLEEKRASRSGWLKVESSPPGIANWVTPCWGRLERDSYLPGFSIAFDPLKVYHLQKVTSLSREGAAWSARPLAITKS